MNLIFQNPFWWFGALALVPLAAHLFSRTRPRRKEFPSVRLLREAMRRVTRVRRPRDRWLLLLRTLAMIALLLAFLQPWLLSRFSGGRGTAKTVVLVLDVSASMGFADGTRTRVAQAAAAAEEVLATLPANSKANIVWSQAHAASALPEPGPNFDYLRQVLRQTIARPEQGDVAGALSLAVRQLAAGEGERELIVISDFQKIAWGDTNWELPPGIQLTRVAIGQEEGANIALAELEIEPARPVAGQDARVVCRVRNLSREPRRVTVFAEAGESRLTTAVEVAPWGNALAIMPFRIAQEGLLPLKASLSEDRFPGDDVRYGMIEVRGALQVSIAGGAENKTARTWERAAQALDGVAVRRLSTDQLTQPGTADVLFVANWLGQASEALTQHLNRGGALVLQSGEGFDPSSAALLGGLTAGESPGQKLATEVRDPTGWRLRVADEDHPAFALFASGAFGDPAKASVRRRVAAPSLPGLKPLLVYEDNRPALGLIEYRVAADRMAPIAWWNVDLAATDWPAQTAFVPFFGEFLRYLGARTGTRKLRVFGPGELLRFDAASAVDSAEVRLVNERDVVIESGPESPRIPDRMASKEAVGPGSYRWMAQGNAIERAVVNFPEAESDLRRLSAAELDRGNGTVIGAATGSRLSALREGRPLWAWCLGAAALFLLLEGILLWRLPVRVETAPSPTPIVSESRSRKEGVLAGV